MASEAFEHLSLSARKTLIRLLCGCVLGLAPCLALGQGGDPPMLRVGEFVQGVIEDGDSEVRSEALDAGYSDAPTVGRRYRVEVDRSGPYHVELRSWHFDAYLVLRDADGNVLAEDDDGLIATHALLAFELDGGRSYVLEACALHGARGPFELVLASGSPRELRPSERAAAGIADLERRVQVEEDAQGPESEAVANALNELAIALYRQGRYAEARQPWERALAIDEKVYGPEHPYTATSLNNLGVLLKALGDYSAARPFYERALAITEEVLGPEHADTALSLSNLAALLQAQGDYSAARPLYERALAIRERVVGPEHPHTATSLNNLAALLEARGDYSAARSLFQRSLAIRENVLGPEHPETATSLCNLALLLKAQGDYSAALPLHERSLAIREKVLGPEHPDTALSLGNLGALLEAQGDYSAARSVYERSLAIQQKVLGPEHPDIAQNLNSLAGLFKAQGDYSAARSLYERSLAIREEVLGPDHPDTAQSLHSLAGLLREQGDYSASRPLYERSLAIREKVLGPDHPETATSLNGLAVLLRTQGDYPAARPLYERALAIDEQVVGPEHPDTAISLNNLALLLKMQGDYSAARPLYERSLAIDEKVLGPEHPGTATSLGNLAALLAAQGEFSRARSLYERSLAIRENILGPEHPGTAQSLSNLALLLADTGELDRARDLLTRSTLGQRNHVQRVLGGLTEAESFQYLAQVRSQLEVVLSLHVSEEPELLVQGYEGLLAWKGRIARRVIASRNQLARDLSEEQRSLVGRLRAQQARLSRLLTEGAGPEQAERMAVLRRERNVLELELTRTLEAASEPEVSFDDLRAVLPSDAAVLDLFVHRIYAPARWEDGMFVEERTWSEDRVVAWITRPEGEGSPLARVDLGPAAALEAGARAFLGDLVARRGVAIAGEEGPQPAEELRRLLWDPLAKHLEGVSMLFVSPDSFLGTLPLETLTLEDGSFLIERLGIVYLSDVTSLARRAGEPTSDYGSLLAMGGVDFRQRADWKPGDDEQAESDASAAASPLRGSFTDYWGRLPATEYESQVVSDLHEDTFLDDGERILLQGAEPTEERLKHELPRHGVLHLATHGFFQPEGTASMWESALDAQGKRETRMSEEAAHLVGKHPGLLSGLVCAGANREAEEGRDDGYLTAEEVGWLDLSGVELVVLSACETGLGRAQSGEGLIGLRRAFEMAGAKTVVSSLWSVKDDSTAELMRDFYKNLWLAGMGRHEALRAAQLAMLRRNRMEHGNALPSTWGAFVLSGEWR